MIKSIRVTNYRNESIVLELQHPEKSGLAIRRIEGLGPAKANINYSNLATGDGGMFNSSRLDARNIVFDLKFMYAPSIEESRQKTYKYFPIKKELKLEIETDTKTTEIIGYVESNEPDIFSPDSATTISIICPDPWLYSTRDQVTIFSGVVSKFEFPFSNESLTENLIEMSELVVEKEQTVFYDGHEEIGVVIYIHAIGPASGITIYKTETRESMILNSAKITALTGSDIQEGDDIVISTVRGNKHITLTRGSEDYNILNCINRDADWFKLTRGDNVFIYTADEFDSNLQFRIENRIAYEGV